MTDLIKKAKSYAIQAHEGQFYGVYEYEYHLQKVYEEAIYFELSEKVQAACWLHDTIEDTNTKYSDLKLEFGKEIAEIVYCVTDELGRNRKERKLKTYPKIKSNHNAILVKLCDRIANVKHCIKDRNKDLFEMYKKEHFDFKNNLNINIHKDSNNLWLVLDDLMNMNI